MSDNSTAVMLGDTGADVSVISEQFLREQRLPLLSIESPAKPILRAANAQQLEVLGTSRFKAVAGSNQGLEICAYVVTAAIAPAGCLLGFSELTQRGEVTFSRESIPIGRRG
jgi:hypothetical protein